MHASEFVKDAMKKAGMTDDENLQADQAPELRCSLATPRPGSKTPIPLKEYKAADGVPSKWADLYRQDMRDILRGYASRYRQRLD